MPITHNIDPNVRTAGEAALAVTTNRTGVFTGLTGGGPLNFDGVDAANVVAGTIFRVSVATDLYDYLAVSGTHAESSPDFINPDSGGSIYWQLQSNHATGAGLGDVVGPASATANAFVQYNGTTGKLVKDSGSAPGTGVLTALAVAVGSAGALVVNGGALGTPSSGTLTSCTGLPIATGVANLGTGVATALGVNVGSAGAPVLFNGAGGTPTSLVLTNATGTPAAITLTNGTGLPGSGLTTGTIPADAVLTLGANTNFRLPAVGIADTKFAGISEAGTAGTTLAVGDLAYFAVADSRWELTDADAEATAGPVKVAMVILAAAADGDPTVLLLTGKIRVDAKFPTFTIGAPVYIDTATPGGLTTTKPSGTDDVVRIVGYGNTADELYFCPSADYYTAV